MRRERAASRQAASLTSSFAKGYLRQQRCVQADRSVLWFLEK